MSPGKVRESERRGERDLAQFEVGCGAVGEEGDVDGVEERAAGGSRGELIAGALGTVKGGREQQHLAVHVRLVLVYESTRKWLAEGNRQSVEQVVGEEGGQGTSIDYRGGSA